jgi:AcrR family transcriptional regulator
LGTAGITDENLRAAELIATALEKAEGKLPPKKRNLVQAAVLCFAEQGFAATSTRQIAERAGVAEATIFRHFKNKQELLERLVTPLLDNLVLPELNAQAQEILDQMPDLRSMLRWMMLNRIEHAVRFRPLVRILLQEFPVNSGLRDVVQEHLAIPVARIAMSQLERLTGATPWDEAEAVRFVRIVASTLLGYIINRLIIDAERQWDDATEVEVMASVLADGIMGALACRK